jgi:rhodanese-related sulfurtransferase
MIGFVKAMLGLGGETVAPGEAAIRLDRGARLVDVREPHEFVAGHVHGALHVPLGRVRTQGAAALATAGLPAAAQEVLLVCHSGVRSRIAQSLLARDAPAGRRYVNVSGGMAGWSRAGLPVVGGRT